MSDRIPLSDPAQVDALQTSEVIEGYWAGTQNEPCGGNRSLDFWHGYRNGMMDRGHMSIDDAARELVRRTVERNRSKALPA